jgi:hypothetical protein
LAFAVICIQGTLLVAVHPHVVDTETFIDNAMAGLMSATFDDKDNEEGHGDGGGGAGGVPPPDAPDPRRCTVVWLKSVAVDNNHSALPVLAAIFG